MKNFKLLLATTAILSMGAMAANALTGETESVEMKAELIRAISLENTEPLDFGRIVVEDETTSLTVAMNSSGVSSVSGTTVGTQGKVINAYVVTQGGKGIITGANCAHLSHPTSAHLNVPTGAPESISIYITGLSCVPIDDSTSSFYGTLHFSSTSSTTPVPEGKYTGSFTVTAIYPDETPSSGD